MLNNGTPVVAGVGITKTNYTVAVDQSASFAPSWQGRHEFDASIGAAANLTLSPDGDLILDPTGNDVLPNLGYDINLGSLAKKYLTLHAAELWVETLVAQNTIATIGGRILVGPTTTLTRDLTAGATTIYVKHNEMASGDRAYFEANGSVEFISIDSAPTLQGAGDYVYTVTRNLDGTGANAWSAGDALFNTGTTGDGFIDIYSVQGIKSAAQLGPSIVGNVRNSATYNDWSEHFAIGNLNGVYGYGVTTYGAAFGKYAANQPWMSVDATNGLRINRGASPSTTLGQWDTAGVITVGDSANEHVVIDGSGVALKDGASIYGLFAATTVLGVSTTHHLELSSGGISFKEGSSIYTSMASGLITVGGTSGKHVRIDSSGVNLKDGSNVYGLFAATTVLGLSTSEHVEISGTSVQIKDGSVVYTDLTAGALSLGDTSNEHVVVNTSGVALKDGGSTYGLFAATTVLGPSASEHIEISPTSVQIKDGSTAYTDLTAGALLLGQTGAGQSNAYLASGGLQLRTNTTVHLDLQSDGDVFIGTDTSAAATTNLAVFTNAQTYNTELVGAGDLLIGDNSASKANILWDKSAGQLLFRGGQTTQAYVDTDGGIKAGAGAVSLDANGIRLSQGTAGINSVTWMNGASSLGEIYAASGSSIWSHDIRTGDTVVNMQMTAAVREGPLGASSGLQLHHDSDTSANSYFDVTLNNGMQFRLNNTMAKIGASPAATGILGIPNAAWISGRNATDNGDVNMIQVDATNTLVLGSFKLTSGAGASKVLTSDANGVGTWATNPGVGAITALTGEVTATGPGSVAATIAAGAVTLPKIANIAANCVLGNNTGSAATAIELTQAQTRTFLGLTALATGYTAASQLVLVASGTGAASLNAPTGNTPTSPADGDLWYDNARKYMTMYTNGLQTTMSRVMGTGTTDTVENTVTETSLVTSYVGTFTIPGGHLAAGTSIRINAYGYYSAQDTSQTLQLKIKLGTTLILDTGAFTLATAASTRHWSLDAIITVRGAGSLGSVFGQGVVVFANDTAGSLALAPFGPNTATTSVNTATDKAVDLTATWGSAEINNVIVCTNLTVELIH